MATKKESWNDRTELEKDLAWAANSLSAVQVGTEKYDIFDAEAREGVIDNRIRIDDIKDIIAGGVNFRGKTAEAIVDGSTKTTISMAGGKSLTVEAGKAGDMVIVPSTLTGKEDREFIWDGEKWNEFGNASNLKALAFADQTSASYTPAGLVSLTTTEKTASLANGAATFNEVSVAATVAIDAYTPDGTISFNAYTPAGDVTIDDIVVGDKKITVKEISSQAFTGTAVTATVNATTQSFDLPTGIEFNQITGVEGAFTGTEATINTVLTASSGSVESTGTLSQLPELSTSGKVNAVTNVTTSTDIAGSATVSAGVLSFNFANVLTAANVTTADVDISASSAYKNTLTTVADLNLTVTGTALTAVTPGSVSYTPAGSVAVDTFEPTGSLTTAATTLTATGTTGDIIATGNVKIETKDVEKTVSIGTLTPNATFKGTAAALGATFTGTAKAPTGTVTTTKFTPEATSIAGNVTLAVPTSAAFAGTAATITGNPA